MRILALLALLGTASCSTTDWVINGTMLTLEGIGFISRTIDDPNPSTEPEPIEDK